MATVDHSGVKYTCPLIDEVISAVKSIPAEVYEYTYWTEKRLIEILEEIRTANSTLRDYGNCLFDDKENLESDVDYFKNKKEYLEELVSDMKKEITELEKQLNEIHE